MYAKLKLTPILLALPMLVSGATSNMPGVGAAMQSAIDAREISGAVTVVVTKDKIVDLQATGMADIAAKKPMRPDSLFWIASMTKPVTAVALLMLQDEGKLKVTDSVAKYIPEFAVLKTPSGKPANLTIAQMMTHTSGLGEAARDGAAKARSLADLIPLFLAAPMQYEPGSKWQYTQSGINVASRIVEITGGLPFDVFVQKRILDPLGMKDTTFYPAQKSSSQLVVGYRKNRTTGALEATPPPSGFGVEGHPPLGNGGLFSTGPDYARLCQMLLAGGSFGGKQYLSSEAMKLLMTVQTGDLPTGFFQSAQYGNRGTNYGWGIGTCIVRAPHPGVAAMLSPGSFGHGGAWGTQAWIDPIRGVAYVLMVQRSDFGNSDGSEIRRAFQQAASDALPKATPGPAASITRDYHFDKTISRQVLENYLSRSISVEGVFNGRGNLDDNLRMLKSIGVKYAGRSLCLWGAENNFLANIERARQQVPKAIAADPDIILEACVFETVSARVEQIAIPDWVFIDLGQPVEKRNFVFTNIIYPVGQRRAMGNAQVPDVSRLETQLWFYYQAASYIDLGFEGIHFGQVEIMNNNDRSNAQWDHLLALVRAYAAKHARRHMVLCNGHTPSGGLVRDGRCLLDFHAFPLRIKENPDKPLDAILQLGFSDGIYNKSKGGVTFSGWKCDHLPYLVEIDNWGVSRTPGQARAGGIWIWGYDEISWFAHQNKQYRADWLKYAWDWVRKTDPNGFLQMPGSRTVSSPDIRWYYANNPSPAVPTGMGDEDAIRAVWEANPTN